MNRPGMNMFFEGLRPLLCAWDPIGVMGPGLDCPRDEYDCLMPVVARYFVDGDSEAKAARSLRRHVVEHMGVPCTKESTRSFIDQARSLWDQLEMDSRRWPASS